MARNLHEIQRIADERDLERLGELSLPELEVVFYRLNLALDRDRHARGFAEFYETVYEMKMFRSAKIQSE
jgi:hypothetical protein